MAVEKDLIQADAQLSDGELDNLLFLPGFSTVTTVSNISGRGVGMDVVKRSVQALGGRISIASRPGLGSTFCMSLPLTLAVLDGMVVSVADETFVVPLTAIVETLRPKKSDVHGLGVESRVIADRGGFAPLIDIGRELGCRADPADPLAGVALVVETEISARCALLVDAIHDQRQVVIKSLEANYRNVPGIAAATILGDGRVALDSRRRYFRRELQPRRVRFRTSSGRSELESCPKTSSATDRKRIHRLPRGDTGVLRRHHVGARDSRLDAGDGPAARPAICARRHKSARLGAADRRSRAAPQLSAERGPPSAMSSSSRRSKISSSGCWSMRSPTF